MWLTPTIIGPKAAWPRRTVSRPERRLALPHISRHTDAGFEGETRRADDHVDALFEKIVRQGVVAVVADERRPHEAVVGVIAAAGDSEGRPIAARFDPEEPAARQEGPLAVGLDDLDAAVVRVGGAEHVAVLGRSDGPGDFDVEPQAGRRQLTERAELRGDGRHLFGRIAAGLRELDRHGLAVRDARVQHTRHEERDRDSFHGHRMSSGFPASSTADPVRSAPPDRQAW